MAASYRASCNINRSLLPLLLLLVATATTVTRSAWVQDYASNHGCGETVMAELCDPGEPAANNACRDACHYSGCRGGRCVYLDGMGAARGCHCMGAEPLADHQSQETYGAGRAN